VRKLDLVLVNIIFICVYIYIYTYILYVIKLLFSLVAFSKVKPLLHEIIIFVQLYILKDVHRCENYFYSRLHLILIYTYTTIYIYIYIYIYMYVFFSSLLYIKIKKDNEGMAFFLFYYIRDVTIIACAIEL